MVKTSLVLRSCTTGLLIPQLENIREEKKIRWVSHVRSVRGGRRDLPVSVDSTGQVLYQKVD